MLSKTARAGRHAVQGLDRHASLEVFWALWSNEFVGEQDVIMRAMNLTHDEYMDLSRATRRRRDRELGRAYAKELRISTLDVAASDGEDMGGGLAASARMSGGMPLKLPPSKHTSELQESEGAEGTMNAPPASEGEGRTAVTSMEDYPLPGDLGPEKTLTCQWEGCSAKPLKNYGCLAKHLTRVHNVTSDSLQGTWVHDWSMMERRAVKLTEDEIKHVNVAYGDDGEVVEDSFVCVPCSKTLKKSVCAKHMTHYHSDTLDVGELRKWATVKDGNSFRNSRGNPPRKSLSLTWAMLTQVGAAEEADEEWGGDDQAEQQGDERCDAGGATLLPARAKAAPSAPSASGCHVAGEPAAGGLMVGAGRMGSEAAAAAAPAAPPAAAAPSAPVNLSALPVVGINPAYTDVELPEPSGPGGAKRTGNWPIKLVSSVPDGFVQWLEDQNTKENQANDFARGVGRFLDMLTWEGQQLSAEVAASPAFLAAFYIQQAHCKVFKLPIMSTQYTWTKKLVDGLKLFCDWHLALVHHQTLMSQDTNADHILGKYRSSIGLLKQYLEGGGVASKISDATNQRLVVKARVDRERLRRVPTLKEMRSGVKQAMLFLQDLEERAQGLSELNPAQQAAATVAMVGILATNGYFGRKKEWEVMPMEHVQSQLDAGHDFLVCPEHKTAKHYGDMAKSLEPGTIEAIKCYARLPRRQGVTTFLVPAYADTELVDVPSALHRYCKKYLPLDKEAFTVNILRKWAHTEGFRMVARNAEQLHHLFTAIDGHSARVADKHYILKDPEDDAALAKEMVKVLWQGRTTPWPSAKAQALTGEAYSAILDAATRDEDVPLEEEEEEEELEQIDGFRLWMGSMPDLIPLAGSGEAAIPIMDAAKEDGAVHEGGDGGEPRSKKAKLSAPAGASTAPAQQAVGGEAAGPAGAPTAGRGRPPRFSDTEQKYIALKCQLHWGFTEPDPGAPPLGWIKENIATQGIEDGIFDAPPAKGDLKEFNRFADAIRHVANTWTKRV